MKLKVFLMACLIACLLTGSVFGAVTGKITGTVTDAQTKDGLLGVSVGIKGTTIGAKTDLDGKYIMLNVPVGTYTVVISSVGYATVEVENVHVSVDLATFQDIDLTTEVTDLGKVITVTAERPMIIKDRTTSVDIIEREQLLAMPTRGFEQVVGIQNSVVRMNSNVDTRQRGGRETSSATASEINLRGGRPSEVAYYVDGFSQQDPLSGISTANINNNAIKEVSVTSGAFSAEYGHVASGVVNVTTNSGTSNYHGNVELVSDNVAAPFGYDSYDQNWYSGDISGPVPQLEGAYFFFSGERRYLRDRAPSIKTKDVYEEFGLDDIYDLDESQRMPFNSVSGWSYQGKIDFELQKNMKLSLNGNGSVDKWQEYRHFYMNPAFTSQLKHSPRYEDKNLGLNAKFTHTLSPESFYNLSFSYFTTERFRGDGAIFDDFEAYERELSNPEFDFENLFREGDSIFLSDLDPLFDPEVDEDSFVTFYESYWANYLHRKSSYIGAKGDITKQMMTHHTVKLGFDFQRHTLRYFENLNATQDFNANLLNRYGFDSLGNESDNEGVFNDTKHPINLGLYLTDRFDWRGFIVNAGLRFDYFDYKALQLINPSSPYDADSSQTDALDSELDVADMEDSEKFTRVSPRIGIAFPISDRTQLYMNFGKFYQRPDLRRLYVGYDFFEARVTAGSFYTFSNPNLKPEKTTAYEFGLTHMLGDNTAFEVVAYYKDVTDLVQTFTQTPALPREYTVFSNTDFGTIKGFDFNLNMRRTRNLTLDIKYSLSYASGTGSYATSNFNIAWKNSQGAPKATNPLDYDQRHSIIGMFDFRTSKGEGPVIGNSHPFENIGLNAIIQFASGVPFTPTNIYDGVSPNVSVQQEPTGGINSARQSWTTMVDVKLEKMINISKYKLVPYLWVRNLLNTENDIAVYEGTGKANTSGYLETPEGTTKASNSDMGSTGISRGEEYEYRYDLAQNNPKNYAHPRMILFGLRMSF
ncbi:MAG: TonB-dependent receptor [FCB group bacterium]|nr:TonB-dependent receptor [FCB group bacterium]